VRKTFLVGRLNGSSTEMVVVNQGGAKSPIPGPWRIRALVRPSASSVSPDPSLPLARLPERVH